MSPRLGKTRCCDYLAFAVQEIPRATGPRGDAEESGWMQSRHRIIGFPPSRSSSSQEPLDIPGFSGSYQQIHLLGDSQIVDAEGKSGRAELIHISVWMNISKIVLMRCLRGSSSCRTGQGLFHSHTSPHGGDTHTCLNSPGATNPRAWSCCPADTHTEGFGEKKSIYTNFKGEKKDIFLSNETSRSFLRKHRLLALAQAAPSTLRSQKKIPMKEKTQTTPGSLASVPRHGHGHAAGTGAGIASPQQETAITQASASCRTPSLSR